MRSFLYSMIVDVIANLLGYRCEPRLDRRIRGLRPQRPRSSRLTTSQADAVRASAHKSRADVHFAPETGQIADIAAGPFRANRRHQGSGLPTTSSVNLFRGPALSPSICMCRRGLFERRPESVRSRWHRFACRIRRRIRCSCGRRWERRRTSPGHRSHYTSLPANRTTFWGRKTNVSRRRMADRPRRPRRRSTGPTTRG
jgi:hypothetical protein